MLHSFPRSWNVIWSALICLSVPALPHAMLGSHTSFTAACPSTRYVISCDAPHELGTLYAYYGGTEIPLAGGFGLLPEHDARGTFSLIILPQFTYKSDEETGCIRYLQRPENAPCAWYDITLVSKEEGYVWSVVTQKTDELPLRLPDYALIILYNPALIEGLEEPEHIIRQTGEQHHSAHTLINLPVLKIKPATSPAMLQEAEDEALLARLDIQHIHTPCTHHQVLAPTVTASMVSAAQTNP